MLRLLIILSAFCVLLATPIYAPTKGKVWPKAKEQTEGNTYYKFTPTAFIITESGQTCDTVKTAIERYTNVLRRTHHIADAHSRKLSKNVTETNTDPNFKGTLEELQINLSAPCESYPYLNMDEKYSLNISAVSTLSSDSMWGVLRGLETFVQLFYMSDDYNDVFVNSTQIEDFPKYPHRGLLIDTSRHYLPVATILKILAAMEMNKMNVLHWHIVDDQSFPYQSEKFPLLSNGAYDPTMIYTASNINEIINYARDRGIRVLPEFDVPGHTRSWGVAYPNILTKCYDIFDREIGLGPMDPTKNATYELISDLFSEVQERFPDKYFHVGGDEVEMGCWRLNPDIQKYMRDHNMTLTRELHSLFMSRVIPLLSEKSTPIVWQEVYDENVSMPNSTIVQVWKTSDPNKMKNILDAGYKVLFSSSWYLDHISGGGDWLKFYGHDPRDKIARIHPEANLENVLGGEACMWGEVVDDTNILSRIWPRASAVAEVLWSGGLPPYYDPKFTGIPRERLEEHVCRMNQRGIPAQPATGPGFCVTEN